MANLPPDLDFSLDRHASPDRMNRAMDFINKRLARVESNAPDAVAVEAATNAAVDASKSRASSEHARAWAEHMPDGIPHHILEAMGISGDHWSSRFWAEKSVKSAEDAENARKILDDLRNRYLGAHVGPPSHGHNLSAIEAGDMYFCTVDNIFYVYTGAKWEPAGGAGAIANTTQDRVSYTATAGQTSFRAIFTAPYVDVYLNGLHLTHNTDFTLTQDSVVIGVSLRAGDVVDIVPYKTYSVAAVNAATSAQVKMLYESNADTHCLTDALLARLIGFKADRTFVMQANDFELAALPNELPVITVARIFKATFGDDPVPNDLVIIEGGGGSASKAAGVYVMIPPVAPATAYTAKYLSSGASSQNVEAYVKAQHIEADPDPTKTPVGSAVYTSEAQHKQIKVVTANGGFEVIFDEDVLKSWVAAGNLFQGTIPTEGTLATLPKPAPANKGFYWTWTAAPSYIVGQGSGAIKDDLLGRTLQIGDWLQSDGVQYVHVPGDLLSKARWDSLGAFNLYNPGTYERGSLVIHRATAGSPLKYYRAKRGVNSLDAAPHTPNSAWEDITPQFSTRDLTDVFIDPTSLANGHLMRWNGTKWESFNPKADWLKIENLDVTLTGLVAGDTLTWDGATSKWIPGKFAALKQPEERINAVLGTNSHVFAIVDSVDNPPATPNLGAAYIVGRNPQGDFVGHANEIATWIFNGAGVGAGVWKFTPPAANRVYWHQASRHLIQWDVAKVAWVDAVISPQNLPPAAVVSIEDWDSTETYNTLNQICVYNGAIYRCIVDQNNLDKEPDKEPTFWDRLSSKTMTAMSDVDLVNHPPQEGYVLTYVTDHWEAKPTAAALGQLTDVDITTTAPTNNQALSWDATKKKWVPHTAASSIETLADVDITTRFPTTGDTLLYDEVEKKWKAGTAAGKARLNELLDVDVASKADKNILEYNATGNKWVSVVPPYCDKAYVDTKFDTLASGIKYGSAVQAIVNSPPISPKTMGLYIVGPRPLGGFAGKANQLAVFDGSMWGFHSPEAGDSHLIEDQAAIFNFNGTDWVKIGEANTATGASSGLVEGIGDIIPWIFDAPYPDGYLECDGRVLASAQYPELYKIVKNKYNTGTGADGVSTFALPDLRGYFLRGAGRNADGTDGGAVGTKNRDSTKRPNNPFTTGTEGAHTHTTDGAGNHSHNTGFSLNNHNWRGGGGWSADATANFTQDGGNTSSTTGHHSHNVSSGGAHSHTITNGGDAETAPKNIAARWLIRYQGLAKGLRGEQGEKGHDAFIFVSDVPKLNPKQGDMWWNSTTGVLNLWYEDGTSKQWVSAIPMPDRGPTGKDAATYISDTPPTVNPKHGDLWFNDAKGTLMIYYADADSAQWISAVPQQKANAVARATTAEIKAMTNPVEGLTVYSTDDKVLCWFNGTEWKKCAEASL